MVKKTDPTKLDSRVLSGHTETKSLTESEVDTSKGIAAASSLGRIYLYLVKDGKGQLGAWALPDTSDKMSLFPAISQAYPGISSIGFQGLYGVAGMRRLYANSYNAIIPRVQDEAIKWMSETLEGHKKTLESLISKISEKDVAERLHQAALRISLQTGEIGLSEQDYRQAYDMRLSQQMAIIDQSANDPSVKEHLKSELLRNPPSVKDYEALKYLKLRILSGILQEENEEIKKLLLILFSSPRHVQDPPRTPGGIWIIEEYRRTADEGIQAAVSTIRRVIFSLHTFGHEVKDNHPDHIWRYPVFIQGGLARLGLQNVPGFPEYAAAIGKVISRPLAEVVIGYLGIAVLLIGFVISGPGAKIALGLIDLALNGASASLAYLRERERELAAEASAFRTEGEEFATSGGYVDAFLAGAAALLSAIYLVNNISEMKTLLSRSGQPPDKLPVSMQTRESTSTRLTSSAPPHEGVGNVPGLEPSAEPKGTPQAGNMNLRFLNEAEALQVIRDRLLQLWGEKPLIRLSERAMIDTLKEGGQLTTKGIEKFVRDLNNFVGETGVLKANTLTGNYDKVLNPGNRDKGLRGKFFEDHVQGGAGPTGYTDLNQIKPNFEVADVVSGNRATGNIISIATGTRERLWEKLEILFDVKVDVTGKVARANRNKFQVGLHELVKNGILDQTNAYSDFVRRARLFVSDHSVNPLKAMVRTKVSDPGIQRMMIDAIISEI